MFRLEFNPCNTGFPETQNLYANVIGDATSIWYLWFALSQANIPVKVFSVMTGEELNPKKGLQDMASRTFPWAQVSY